MSPVVDFTGVKTELEVLPEDIYPATLSSWEYTEKSKESGKPYITLAFEIAEGDFEGRKMFRNFSLQRQSLWALKRALVRLGSDVDSLEGPLDLEEIMPDLVGAPCNLKLGQHTYDDELRNDVKSILPADYAFSSSV